MQVKLNMVLFYDSPRSSLYFTISNFSLPFVKNIDQAFVLPLLSLFCSPCLSQPKLINPSSLKIFHLVSQTPVFLLVITTPRIFVGSSSFTQSLKPEVPSSKVLTLLPISNRTTLGKCHPVFWPHHLPTATILISLAP